jgi:hypothetical protein
MIRDVKIFLAKIKDGKGKDLYFLNKKSLPTITPPQIPKRGDFLCPLAHVTSPQTL